jgi:hypothetical protein
VTRRQKGLLTRILPLFEADATITLDYGVLLEALVVSIGMVRAEMRAAALGARESRNENGVRNAAHGLRLGQPAARLPLCRNFGEACFAGSLRGQTLAQ